MRDIAVVFDTNVYRDLCDVRQVGNPLTEVDRFIEAFQQRNITAFANPYVFMELAAHLATQQTLSPFRLRRWIFLLLCALKSYSRVRSVFNECRNAIRAQHKLCSPTDHRTLWVLSDSETLVAKALFQQEPAGFHDTTLRLCTLSRHLFENTPGRIDDRAYVACRELHEYIVERERLFVSDMWQYVIQGLNPSSTDWAPLENNSQTRTQVLARMKSPIMVEQIAAGFVLKAQAMVGAHAANVAGMSQWVANQFATPILLYREILKRIVETGCNIEKKKRSNWIWDIQIAMGIGQPIANVNKVLHLVTTDNAIVHAAKESGNRNFVHTLEEFRTAIDV